MKLDPRRFLAAVTAAGLLLGLAACGGDDDTGAAADEETTEQSSDPDSDAPDEGDGEGRAFDADRDTTESAIMTGTSAVGMKPDEIEWDGDTIRLIYDDGSVEATTAVTVCTAVDTIIAEDESGVIVFPDGEAACDDMP